MNFKNGDRVRSIKDWSPALREGDLGTVIDEDLWGDPMIYWDEYNEERHNYDGEVPVGHGWFIDESWIELVEECDDLGEFTPNLAQDSIADLFGGCL